MSYRYIKIIFIFIFAVSFAQTKDSLYVKQLIKQSKKIKHSNTNEASILLDEAIAVSSAINYHRGAYEANIKMGQLNYKISNHNISFINYNNALAIAMEYYPKSNAKIAQCYLNIGIANINMGNNHIATKNYLKALSYSIGKDKITTMQTYYELGLIYNRFHQNDVSIEYYISAYEIAEKIKDTSYLAKILINLSITYINKGALKKALKCINEAVPLVNASDNIYNKVLIKKAQAVIHLEKGESNKALAFALTAYKLANKHNIGEFKTKTLNLLGKIYGTQNKHYLSLTNYLEALSYSQKYKNIALSSEISNSISKLYNKKKEYAKAYYYLNECKKMDDSLINEKSSKLMALYISEKRDKDLLLQTSKTKNKENLLLKRKNRLLYIVGGFTLAILILFSFYHTRVSKFKEKYNERLKRINSMLKQSRASALITMQTKTSILNNITHELKTPLQTISSVSQLLSNDKQGNLQKKYLDTIDFSVKNLLNLINNAITLNSGQKEKAKLELNPFNLSKTVDDIVGVLQIIGLDNKLQVFLDPKIKHIELLGDEPKLIQILSNLLENANKYTQSGDIILQIKPLRISRNAISLQFSVSDTGEGIEAADLNKIFAPFYRVSEVLTSKTSGSGLGLSIVKNLISAHNSSITVSSEKGKGSTFKFELNYEIASILHHKQKIDPTNIKILIVEDHKINQMLIKKNIEQEGFVCKIANNGLEAVNLVKKENFDIILTDIMMPIMDGFESSKIIKKMRHNLPIIAITAVSENEERQKFEEAQIHTVINKPINVKELFKSIYTELNISKLQLSA